jgi:predicted signal transduction protein with EAL and GGDEF domain
VTISIGVESIIPRSGQSTADLVEAADRALYAAKRCGRNRISSNLPSVVTISELEAPFDYELPSSLVA